MAKKTDLRVLRTQKMIFEAFMKLVEENGFESVTVQQIADEAMINRATFYAHFKDKQDLYDQVFNYAMEGFFKTLDPDILIDGNKVQSKTIQRMLTLIFIEIQENKTFFAMATEGPNNIVLTDLLTKLLKERYATLFEKLRITQDKTVIPTDFIISYMTSIFLGSVHWWIHSDGQFSPEHMAKLIIQLVANGHLTVLGIEVLWD